MSGKQSPTIGNENNGLQHAKNAVAELQPDELAAFAQWFQDEIWDRQIERDAADGLLDDLMDEALADFEAGRCTPI